MRNFPLRNHNPTTTIGRSPMENAKNCEALFTDWGETPVVDGLEIKSQGK